MASTDAPPPDPAAGRIAAWCAVVGFLAALMIAALSGRLSLGERTDGATILGDLGFMVAFLAPFVAGLVSFCIDGLELRRAIWMAAGLLSLILALLTIFSGLWLLFGPVGLGLIAAWWMAKGRPGLLGPARSVALSVWLIFWLGCALGALWLRETPGCWRETESESSYETCWTDVIDATEGSLAIAGVAIGFAGIAFIGRGGSAGELAARSRTIHGRLSSGSAARR